MPRGFQFVLLVTHYNFVVLISDGLKDHFSEFGNVSDSVVMVDATTKRSRYSL